VPDELRGRMMGMQMAAVAGAPRIGDVESGAVAAAFTPLTSVVSGGLACVAGALILARLLPAFRRQEVPASHNLKTYVAAHPRSSRRPVRHRRDQCAAGVITARRAACG
jgi:hypothetical protein